MPSPQLKDSEKKNTNSILKLYNLLPVFFQRVPKRNFKKRNKSVNTVIWWKSIGIQTCLPCRHEIRDAVKDVVEGLVLNVENQFIDDALNRESVYSNTSKSEYETKYDTEYEPDSSFQLDQLTCLSDDQFSEQQHLEEQLSSNNLAFIVYWSSLVLLLQYCLSCPAKALVNSGFIQGSALVVELICKDGHISLLRLQPRTSNFYEGNIVLAASILFSANTFSKIKKYFELACIPFILHTSYYNLQKDYLFGVANEAWVREGKEVVSKISQPHPCVFSGDGRYDSPGHNAKYLTYTFLEHSINKIVAMSVTQFSECGNSNRMEKYGFQKVLHGVEARDINIKQITTGRHVQIKKIMREEHPNISHQFDVWHVCKNIHKKLLKAAKKKSTSILSKWIKSICNHFWWSCATCSGCEHMLCKEWTSILFHIQSKHNWLANEAFVQILLIVNLSLNQALLTFLLCVRQTWVT